MRKLILVTISTFLILITISCNENNTEVNNNTNPSTGGSSGNNSNNEEGNSGIPSNNNADRNHTPKTNEELIFEGSKLLLNTAMDIAAKQRIKDSINRTNKEKMYAYQIGLQYREKDAFDTYNRLTDAGILNLYVFKAGRKEYYIVKFEAKGEEELKTGYGDFKTLLGDNGIEGVKVVNLMEFCSKKETIIKQTETAKGKEIKCLACG